jgi:transcriptional regulator with XRE-family HTH domain
MLFSTKFLFERIGAETKKARIANRLTQKNLAELSRVSIPTIQKIENGDMSVNFTTLVEVWSILENPYSLRQKLESLTSIESKSSFVISQRVRLKK